MTTMTKHYVTFYSPGTFLPEQTTKEIDSWDPQAAAKMAAEITERYNAKPYCFVFSTRTRGPNDFDSKETARSARYFVNCKRTTREQVEARANPDEINLRRIMVEDGIATIVEPLSGFKASIKVEEGDVFV